MSSLNIRKTLDKVTENWVAKAASVGLAVFLFVFHRMTTLETRFFSVPLSVETNSAFVPSSTFPRVIRVSLRGDANSIYPILEDDIEAYIDLKKYNSVGLYRSPVQVRKKGSALGLEPLEIVVDPVEISLSLDRRVIKYLPLSANLRGNVEAGYDLESHSLSPTQVAVDGPAGVLETVSELHTDYVDLDGRSEDFSVMVNILNPDPLIIVRGNGMTEFKGYISLSVPVRNIDGLPIIPTGLNPLFQISIDRTGSVRIEGSKDDIDQFTPSADFLSVDCSEINAPGEYNLPVRIQLPRVLSLVRLEPVEIKVNAELREGL